MATKTASRRILTAEGGRWNPGDLRGGESGREHDRRGDSMSSRERGLTSKDLAQWVDNDEGLYRWWRNSKQTKRAFIATNRDKLKRIVQSITSGDKRPHYLIYG